MERTTMNEIVVRRSTTKASQRAVNKYVKNHYDRFSFCLPKGTREMIKEVAEQEGISMNELYCRALELYTGRSIR